MSGADDYYVELFGERHCSENTYPSSSFILATCRLRDFYTLAGMRFGSYIGLS
jgi:hypothetical protein